MEQEVDICQCRKCGKLEVRKQDGYFPDGRNKRFVNLEGAQWNGRKCPGCQQKNSKVHIQEKRKKAKNADPSANA